MARRRERAEESSACAAESGASCQAGQLPEPQFTWLEELPDEPKSSEADARGIFKWPRSKTRKRDAAEIDAERI